MSVDVSPDDPRIPSRPLWGLAILTLPILGIFVMFIAYGVMWGLGLSGRQAAGEPVTLTFEGCPEARPLLEARLADMGLSGEWTSTASQIQVTAALTGDPEVDANIPDTLASPGALEIRADGEVVATNANVTEASVRMDLFMVPYVLLHLDPPAADRVRDFVRADPEGKVRFWVDGQEIGWQSNSNPVAKGDLEINPAIPDELERMHAVAAWSVTLDHGPLPCTVHAVQ